MVADDNNKSATVEITTLTNGGDGLGRVDGKAVFVGVTAPGDVVQCELTVVKKRYAKGRLLQVITPSVARIKPECAHFATCGGCDWQMLSYADQCVWKERLLRENCQHQLKMDEAVFQPLLASDAQHGYRSRVQLKCSCDINGFKLGFYQRGSHKVVDVTSCPVADARINQLLPQLRQLFVDSKYAQQINQIDVAVGDGGRPRVVFHHSFSRNVRSGSHGRLPSLNSFCATLKNMVGKLDFACCVQDESGKLHHIQGEYDIYIEVGTPMLRLAYAPGGFAQINLQQNRVLVDLVVEAARSAVSPAFEFTVLDLYCGMGNFSLPLARYAKKLIGVESYADSIKYAKSNAAQNGITNATFKLANVADYVRQLVNKSISYDVVVLDPPRAGAKESLAGLLALKPRRIIYVSCDQQTLLRDIQVLVADNYRLTSIQPLDMFPQTAHTEVVAVMDFV